MLLTRPRTAVEPPYDCQLVEIGAETVPYLLGALFVREQRYNWLTDNDAIVARRMLAKQGADLLMPCGKDIVQSMDRVYMLLNRGLTGQTYSYSGTGTEIDPYVYSPPIPVVPDETYVTPGLMARLEDLRHLLQNALNGETIGGYTDTTSIRAQLEALIVTMSETDDLDDDILEQLVYIVAALA